MKTHPSSIRLWWEWVLATGAASAIGTFIFSQQSILMYIVGGFRLGLTVLGVTGVAIFALIGLVQSIILKRYVERSWRWIAASVVGCIIYGVLVSSGAYLFPYARLGADLNALFFRGDAYSGATLGFMVGLFQWFILRGKVKEASWWIPINVVSYALALPVTAGFGFVQLASIRYPIFQSFGANSLVNSSVILSEAAAVSGLVAGALTGLGLLWLMRHNLTIEEGQRVETTA